MISIGKPPPLTPFSLLPCRRLSLSLSLAPARLAFCVFGVVDVAAAAAHRLRRVHQPITGDLGELRTGEAHFQRCIPTKHDQERILQVPHYLQYVCQFVQHHQPDQYNQMNSCVTSNMTRG